MNICTSLIFADWTGSVSPGDLVLSRFPFPSTEDCQTRCLRPCLVLDRDMYLGAMFLALVPGVPVQLEEQRPGDLIVDESALFAGYKHLGPIRFLPELTDRFDTGYGVAFPRDRGSTVIGRVHGAMLGAVEHMRGQHLAYRKQHMDAHRKRHARGRLPAEQ